jgi:hypothetical protein
MTSVPIIRFRAGTNVYALAAGCVTGVGAARSGVPHLARVMGDDVEDSAEGARALTLAVDREVAEIIVDSPVALVDLVAEQIAPCRTTTNPNVMGFARDTEGMYAILDAARLIELVRAFMARDHV